jgi:hypothetical protein
MFDLTTHSGCRVNKPLHDKRRKTFTFGSDFTKCFWKTAVLVPCPLLCVQYTKLTQPVTRRKLARLPSAL